MNEIDFFIRRMNSKEYSEASQIPEASMQHVGFVFLSEGEALVESKGKSFILFAGHLLIIPKDCPFSVHFFRDVVGYGGFFPESMLSFPKNPRALLEPIQQAFWFDEGSFVSELFTMLSLSYERNDMPFIEKGLELLVTRIRPGTSPAVPGFVSEFLDIIFEEGDLHEDIPVYASRLHVSGNYLSRVVKQVTGRTVGDWIEIARLEKAKRLLKETTMPMIDVSMAVGLDDQSYFSRFFKKMTRQTPTDYRKQMQG